MTCVFVVVETRKWKYDWSSKSSLVRWIIRGKSNLPACVCVCSCYGGLQKWKKIMGWWRSGRLGKCSNICFWCSHRGQRKQPGQFDHEEWTQLQDGGMRDYSILKSHVNVAPRKLCMLPWSVNHHQFPYFCPTSTQCIRSHDRYELKMVTGLWLTNTHHSRMTFTNDHDKSNGSPSIGGNSDWKKSI